MVALVERIFEAQALSYQGSLPLSFGLTSNSKRGPDGGAIVRAIRQVCNLSFLIPLVVRANDVASRLSRSWEK